MQDSSIDRADDWQAPDLPDEPGWELTRHLRDCLIDKGWQPEVDLSYVEIKGAGHSEAAWAARVEPALRFLFPPAK